MTGGDVIFNFKGNTNDIEKDTKGLASKVKGIAGGIATGLGAAAAVGATALSGMVAASVKNYADTEQLVGGVETLFKDSADQIIANSKKAYETAGISANQYMEQVTSFSASLLQSVGGDTVKAAQYADMAVKDMADNANKMGTNIEAIQNAYQGFAKQNYTMLDNLKLGYGGTKTEMERLLSDASKITGIKYDINNLNDVYNAIHVIQGGVDELNGGLGDVNKGLGITGTTAKEANDTITGSVASAKAAFTNFLSGTGGIEEVIKTFTTAGTNISKAVIAMAPDIVNGIVGLVNGLIPQIPTLLQNLLPTIINGTILLIQGLIGAIPQIMTVLLGALPTIIEMLLQGMVQIVTTLAKMLPELMPQIVEAILSIIPILIDNLPLFIQAGWQLITGLLQGIIESVPALLSYIPKIITSMFNYWKQIPSMMKDVGKNLIKGLWNGIKDVTGWITDKIKGFGSSVLESIKGIFGIHSPSTEFEYIGVMNVKGMEKGLEKEKAQLQDTFDSMFDLSPSLYGTSSLNLSPNVNVEVYSSYKQDPLGQMVSDVKTFSGGSKNDYNYGQGV